MEKHVSKTLSLLLAATMATATLAGCGAKTPASTTPGTTGAATTQASGTTAGQMTSPIPAGLDYDATSAFVYDAQMGEFKAMLDAAKEAGTQAERFAIMAQAEAKLLETATLIPNSTRGGNFTIGRLAKRTAPTVFWGTDAEREHNAIVTTELIKAEDQNELKKMWDELKGTGTYEDKAAEYLESKGYTLKDTYSKVYTTEPKTWDATRTSYRTDMMAIVNTYDGLVEYDMENELQPALAESWEVSEDGLSYTFHLRQGVKWVDAQGREIGEVKADDFVAGMQHMMDTHGGLEYLVDGVLVNAHEYMAGEMTDFTQVGVKAADDYTVVYTLEEPASYFMTMLGYGVFAPVNRQYFLSKGGDFGLDAFQAAVDSGNYTYGNTPNDIAYCGPYLVTNATAENTIVFEANPTYWNKDNIRLQKIVWKFDDGKDPTKAYNDAKSAVLDAAGLNSAATEACKKDGLFEEYVTVSDTDASTFMMYMNVNRQAYANVNDSTKAVSAMTEDQKLAANIAMFNPHFRMALAMGLDAASYNAQAVGEELKLTSIRNSFTPGNFVTLPEEATISINGTEKTYPAGTYFGQIVQDQLDADGVKIKAWDAENKTSDGFVGWYSPENAMEQLNMAIEEVKEYGLEISPENPVYLDLPVFMAKESEANRANVLKQSIETSLQGNVVINIVECADQKDQENAGFFIEDGSQANYTIYNMAGWGPDYGDPQTYLDAVQDNYSGSLTMYLGMY